jgi:cilia- and flagella-associated protein 52
MESSNLNLLAVIGFNGTTLDGMILHPDNEHLIFPLGSQIVIRNVLTRTQRFLRVKIKFYNQKLKIAFV